MQEIWIPEFIITVFLLLSLVRPFSKKLKAHDGIAWLPLPAFLIGMVLFPAYGFRPELLPLFVYAAVLAGISIFRAAAGGARFGNSRRPRIILALPSLIVLTVAAGLAFWYTPRKDTALSTQGVYALSVTAGDREYFIRVYTDENDSQPSRRPLIVIMPPVIGSSPAVDQVSCDLRDRGFTVLCYSRRGFGSWQGLNRLSAFFSGTVSARANRLGCALEEARKTDLLFLLSWIRQNPQLEANGRLFDVFSQNTVFLAGYDAGGSALVLLGNSLSPGTIKISGLIAIESPLWSLYREESPNIGVPPPDGGGFHGWFQSIRYGLNCWFLEMKPKKIAALGEVPELSTPVLFLVSDRIWESKYRDGKYLALLKTFQSAKGGVPGSATGSAVLASADGAGPLDYSDFPVRYPLVSALFPGFKTPVHKDNVPGISAGIITWFAANTLKDQGAEPSSPLDKAPLPPGVQVIVKP